MKKIIIIVILFYFILCANASVFDAIEWEKIYESNGIIVYIQKNRNEKINYYKAEKIISQKISDDLYKNILSFDSYPKIFPRTITFNKIKQLNENKIIIYSLINFKPLKNRDYYIYFETYKNKNESRVEWTSITENDLIMEPPQKNVLRAKNLNGRWVISENGSTTKITVELHNDFEINIPSSTMMLYEISSAAEMIDNLVSYTLKNK